MVLSLCGLSSLGIWVGIGLILSFIVLAFLLFRAGKDTTWFKHPSLSVLIVSTVLVVWQFVGCDEQMMWTQLTLLVLIAMYLLFALIHQRD